jgi:glycosyltransferase involved in cell wall biosynthesis
MSKNILLVDPPSDGHHTTYIAHIARALINNGCHVYCYHSNNAAVTEWLSTNSVDVSIFTDCYKDCSLLFNEIRRTRFNLIITQFKKWQAVKRCIASLEKQGVKIDYAFFSYIDSLYIPGFPEWMMNRFFCIPWSCLCFRPPHQRQSLLKKIAADTYSILNSKNCTAIGLLEENLMDEKYRLLPLHKKFFFPDFCDVSVLDGASAFVDKIKKRANGRPVVGTIGSISKRKGIIPLLKCAQSLAGDTCFFVFAGQFVENSFSKEENDYIKVFLNSKQENCLFELEFIPDEAHFNSIVQACDILTVLYADFPYSSNIFSKAAAFGKLIVGSNYGCIADRITRFRLGITVQHDNHDSINTGLKTLLQNKAAFQADALFDKYKELHSEKNIATALIKALEL